ncbi:formyltransferase family protein [Helicobacter fennelliae]|uniref:formyltransferase family protein n=1 Tax=Helicobacter fennelliae TaxID=215 RepID=UPI000E176730|nr:formyltransferase family protein [Helicobacter fennelliae]STP06694.1 putative methionyl-tRNA formyltransferase [Helicobacter fennelliae]
MKNLIFAHDRVGFSCVKFLLQHYLHTIRLIVVAQENQISTLAREYNIPVIIFDKKTIITDILKQDSQFDFGFLLWWSYIIDKDLISIPRFGFINTHPSLLPFNRGKHYSFWAIVEQNPFGVSLHFVDEGIDSGDIIAQKVISYDWEDTGKSLYQKAQKAIVALFKAQYKKIITHSITRTKQNLNQGSFHYAKEIDSASTIDLNKSYIARDLLNLLRAKSFKPHKGCVFKASNGGGQQKRVEARKNPTRKTTRYISPSKNLNRTKLYKYTLSYVYNALSSQCNIWRYA